MSSSKWSLSVDEESEFIHVMTEELAPLRVRADITQEKKNSNNSCGFR